MNYYFQRNIVYSPCIDAICFHRPAFDPLLPIVARKLKIEKFKKKFFFEFQIFPKSYSCKYLLEDFVRCPIIFAFHPAMRLYHPEPFSNKISTRRFLVVLCFCRMKENSTIFVNSTVSQVKSSQFRYSRIHFTRLFH